VCQAARMVVVRWRSRTGEAECVRGEKATERDLLIEVVILEKSAAHQISELSPLRSTVFVTFAAVLLRTRTTTIRAAWHTASSLPRTNSATDPAVTRRLCPAGTSPRTFPSTPPGAFGTSHSPETTGLQFPLAGRGRHVHPRPSSSTCSTNPRVSNPFGSVHGSPSALPKWECGRSAARGGASGHSVGLGTWGEGGSSHGFTPR